MPSKKDLALIESHEMAVAAPLDIKQILERTKVVAQVMEQVMEVDVHYGIIPGCKKPSLYKAGAEKIAVTFQLAIDTEIEDLSHGDEIRYRVHAIARSISGQFLGSAHGECSSHEEKYRWRKANKTEFEDADDDAKRIKEYSSWKTPQIHTNPADIANTVLQMADKRAYVAVVRKVTAASDVFTQGVEDLQRELLQNEEAEDIQPKAKEAPTKKEVKNAAAPEKESPVSDKVIGTGPMKVIQAKLNHSTASAEDLCKKFGVGSIPELPLSKINDVFSWIKEQG